MKVKPEFEITNYPLQYADITLKYFNIKELYSGCVKNNYLRKILFNSIPVLAESHGMIFKYMDFTNEKEFLTEYIKVRDGLIPDVNVYINQQNVSMEVDLGHKIVKKGR